MNKEKLLNKNFLLVIIGQLISIFANSILRFILPLYILDKTGSTAVFGSILAVAAVPPILFSPLGGILADNYNRKNIMVILDFITAAVISCFAYFLIESSLVIIIAILMIIFSIIQSFYQPAVQASIAIITSEENLEKANGIVSLVNAISNLLGPIAAGILYGIFRIKTIMLTSGGFFALAALMEMFIYMKFERVKKEGSFINIIKSDFKMSVDYMLNKEPVLFKIMLIISAINLFLTSMTIVGLPVMIKIQLHLSSKFYGFAEALMALGMITGGIAVSISSKKINTEDSYKMLTYASLGLLPVALAFSLKFSVMTTYYIIIMSFFLIMFVITIFSITMMSFVQRETPDHLLAKLLSYIMLLTQLSLPFGQLLYGLVFEKTNISLSLIVFLTALCSFLVAVYSKNTFKMLEERNFNKKYVQI